MFASLSAPVLINANLLCNVFGLNRSTCSKLVLDQNNQTKILQNLGIASDTSEVAFRLDDNLFMEFTALKRICIRKMNIARLPPQIPDTVLELIVTHTQITVLPPLPRRLEYLSCSNNRLTKLPPLPTTLGQINCDHNMLTKLPALNRGLINLYCQYNSLEEIGPLPETLKRLHCYYNRLREIPALPNGLQELKCLCNPLIKYPYFTAVDVYTYFEIPTLPQYTDIIKSYAFETPAIAVAYNEEHDDDKKVIDMAFFEKLNRRTAEINDFDRDRSLWKQVTGDESYPARKVPDDFIGCIA